MNFLKYFIFKTIKYNLINKYSYKILNKIPKLEKIILNFSCKTSEVKKLSIILLAIELLSSQKGVLTVTKNSNIFLKIKKGCPIGCKITLRKNNKISILANILFNIMFKANNFKFSLKKHIKNRMLSCRLKEISNFKKFEKNYQLFYNLPNLNVIFIFSPLNQKELVYFAKLFQLTYKIKQI